MIDDILYLINELEDKIKEIKLTNKNGLTQYTEGKIDGINYVLKELEELLDQNK